MNESHSAKENTLDRVDNPSATQNEPGVKNEFRKKHILNMQEWIDLKLSDTEAEVIIGSPTNPLIRPRTKNLIEAPEKHIKQLSCCD